MVRTIGKYALLTYLAMTCSFLGAQSGRHIPIDKQTKTARADVILDVAIQAQQVYVGQQVPYTISLLLADGRIAFDVIEVPEIDHVTHGQIQGPRRFREERNGVNYFGYQWWGNMYPHKSGFIDIPSFQMNYQAPQKNRRNRAGGWMHMFSRDPVRTVISKPQTCHVRSLPPYTYPVDAIGDFEDVRLDVDRYQMAQGEAATMQFVVKARSRSNIDMIKHPEVDISKGMKYFPDTSWKQANDGITVRVFQYIIQAHEPGDMAIPVQAFRYFDPSDEVYRALYTQPKHISVTPGAAGDESDRDTVFPDVVPQEPGNADQLVPTPTIFRSLSIPWWLFLVLSCIPIAVFIGMICMYMITWCQRAMHHRIRARRAYKRAAKRLREAERDNRIDTLYGLFYDVILYLPDVEVMRLKDFSHAMNDSQRKKDWDQFAKQLEEASFGHPIDTDNVQVFRRAHEWLQYIKRFV